MLNGWLVVNQYYRTPKFSELYGLLLNAAVRSGVQLTLVGHAEIVLNLRDGRIVRPEGDRPDFVLFWDKDILLARSLELLGLRLFNCCEAIALCDDKALTALRLARAGVRQPLTLVPPFTYPGTPRTDWDYFDRAAEMLGFPLVLKESKGSFGYQVSLISSAEELRDKVTELCDRPFILQQFIAPSRGRDIRVNVVGNKAVASMLRESVCGDFRSNLTLGGRCEPYTLSHEQESAALEAVHALELDFAGVDVLFGGDGPLICEVNSNAHFKTTLDCTGVNLADHIMAHITETMK